MATNYLALELGMHFCSSLLGVIFFHEMVKKPQKFLFPLLSNDSK
jgi:predicted Ser/Thr protein kinase